MRSFIKPAFLLVSLLGLHSLQALASPSREGGADGVSTDTTVEARESLAKCDFTGCKSSPHGTGYKCRQAGGQCYADGFRGCYDNLGSNSNRPIDCQGCRCEKL
ncbi:hypothetical protein B0H10DRAFT_1977236 [Mycena sp. CBHHK59/15]|nr:hypothetical protein B0H10DRAFT_1977236 [Mycena sp. CBHHK59/15]